MVARMHRILLLALIALTPAAASAAERQLTVTSFDRIVVEGPFDVTVTTGRGSSARASGDPRAIEGIAVRVNGRTLTVRPSASTWGGWPGAAPGVVRIAVSTPELLSARLSGSGRLAVDRMKGGTIDVALSGDGALDVGAIDSDRLTAALLGAGALTIAGRSAQAVMVLQGPGRLDATRLAVDDLSLTSSGTGAATAAARRSAKVTANGTGNIAIEGSPACTVRARGAGVVRCGDGGD